MASPEQRAPQALTGAAFCGYPLKLEPVFVERVWGASMDSSAVAAIYPRVSAKASGGQRIGEVWLTGDDSRIANGAHAGRTLGELARGCGESLLGYQSPDSKGGGTPQHPSGQSVFPLLVKFLFTTDKLSVQVHPPDHVAARKGSWGKTEMWHILRAEPGAQLGIGFRDGLPEALRTPQSLREAAATGAIEQMLDWREVRAGETFFIPAGTVHAIGGGLTLCEIQQNSDITYRLFDYNRPGTDGQPRPLHLDEALEVIEWQPPGGRTSPFEFTDDDGARALLAACPYFATERWDCVQPLRSAPGRASGNPNAIASGEARHMEIWILLEGAAEFEAGGERVSCGAGEVVVIPADVVEYIMRPHTPSIFLRTYPPDWEQDVCAPLRAAGASDEQLRRVAFPMRSAREGAAR